jgi:MoaA/NifB/PqqE/SkfB family radical SAM enzyme
MEPTLDKRLADVMLLIANSPARPKIEMILQTNGILLHRHDHEKMQQAGLGRLAVSVDAASPQTQKSLRDGTSLDKVVRNVSGFIAQCPKIPVDFITTVTSENVSGLESLVELGLDLGVTRFIFREMFYYPDNKIVDHARMPGLMLKEGQFMSLVERIRARFEKQADLVFATADFLHESSRQMHENAGTAGQEARSRRLRAMIG